MSKIFTFGIFLLLGIGGIWSGHQGEILEEIEAVDDFGSTIVGESVSINVLANDKGEEIEITQIVTPASCGETSEWQADGSIVYTADETTSCTFDSFQYEIKDKFGAADTATVIVAISQPSTELVVEVGRDCLSAYETGEYTIDIFIYNGIPPFQISVNETGTILYDLGKISFGPFIDFIETYEINIIDSLNQHFYEKGGERPCVSWICDEVVSFHHEFTCLGEGKIRTELFTHIEEAHWIDFDGVQHSLEQVDTIPTLSYINIPLSNGFVFDTLLNCLTAHDDFFEVSVETPFTFNVLENDFGQEIKVSQIVKMPNCGELIEWSPNGTMTYQINENSDCPKDTIIYELENATGEKTTAIVALANLPEKDLSITWETSCDDWWFGEVLFSFQIHGGSPPYTSTGSLNGTINQPNSEISLLLAENDVASLEVVDSEGQMAFLEVDMKFQCAGHPDECYEPLFIHQYLEIECLETG